MDTVLAFDISTSIIGWALVKPKSTLADYPIERGNIDLRKVKGGFWDKVSQTREEIKLLNDRFKTKYDIKGIYIEDPLKKFARGKSSAGTISLLARFNAIVSFFVLETFSIQPLYIDATFARKKIGVPLLSRKKSGGLSQKEQTFSFLCLGVFKNEIWPTNKNGRIQPWCYDEVDAFVIAIAGCLGFGEPA